MAASAQNSLVTIENFLSRVGGMNKTADGSKAHTEPGSIGGETSHPVKNVDDKTRDATEGSRSKENTSDVKEDQGKPSVENAAEAKPKTASAVAANFAKNPFTQKIADEVSSAGSAPDDAEDSPLDPQPTGKGEGNTDTAKAGKTDPGSTHPARTDNNSIDGHKWAADDPVKMASDLAELGNQLLAQVSWLAQSLGDEKTAAVAQQVSGQTPQAPNTKQAQLDPHIQAQLGWEMAGLLSGQMDKAAADRMVQEALEQVIKTASDDAIKVVHYLDNFFAGAVSAQKQAEGEEMPPPPGGGGMPPMDPAQMAGGGPPGPDQMGGGGGGGAAMGGAGAMGGGEAPGGGGGGGEEMMAALGGGHPADGGGAGAMGGGEGGGGGSHEQEAALLAQLCEQLGVTPEQLMAAMHEEGGAGGAGGAGEAGGGLEAEAGGGGGGAGEIGGGIEHQGSDRGNGRKPVKQGSAKRSVDETSMRDYITEVVQRSRRNRG